MAGLFGAPAPPKPQTIAPPDKSSDEIAALAAEQRKELLKGKGTSYLTGGLGVPGGSTSFSGARLLGGK
jgi:hypothetical protein